MPHGIFIGAANEPKMAPNYSMKTAPAIFIGTADKAKMTQAYVMKMPRGIFIIKNPKICPFFLFYGRNRQEQSISRQKKNNVRKPVHTGEYVT